MSQAILKEMNLRSAEFSQGSIETIYLGGGTPSLLSSDQLGGFLEAIAQLQGISEHCEITMEVNPDDVTPANLNRWKLIGVNRLSIGIQSFSDRDLRFMNRSHSSAQAIRCLAMAQDAGFSNISCDLIYGIPDSALSQLEKNIRSIIESDIPHLSAYHLTVEPDTVFGKWKKNGQLHEIEDSTSKMQYDFLIQMLERESLIRQYEVSNFAIPGKESKHNSSYWSGAHYVGLGPSAHSYDGRTRKWNVSNNHVYMKKIASEEIWFESETLTQIDKMNELVLTRMRTVQGLDMADYEKRFKKNLHTLRGAEIKNWTDAGMLEIDNKFLRLTRDGMLFADRIASDLFVLQEELT